MKDDRLNEYSNVCPKCRLFWTQCDCDKLTDTDKLKEIRDMVKYEVHSLEIRLQDKITETYQLGRDEGRSEVIKVVIDLVERYKLDGLNLAPSQYDMLSGCINHIVNELNGISQLKEQKK